MDVIFIDELDVLNGAVVAAQRLDIVLLYLAGLFRDTIVTAGDRSAEEARPFVI